MTNKSLNSKKIVFYKKILIAEYKGGKCQICKNNNILQFCYHHINPEVKETNINKLWHKNFSEIKKEVDKCICLCQNCHQELHYNLSKIDNKRKKSKEIFIKYKGGKCEECGYDKCISSLTFHHIESNNKIFEFRNLRKNFKSINELPQYVIDELDKCQLLCRNCHYLKHNDIEYFNKNKVSLYENAHNYKEKKSKIDVNLVINMFNDGFDQNYIRKTLNCAKSTISNIICNNLDKLTEKSLIRKQSISKFDEKLII